MNHIFECDLKKLTDKIMDDDYAVELYRALCNMRWQNIEDPGNIYSCSWRYAGVLVAQIRRCDEYYMDYYCSGREGQVSERIEKDLKLLGWSKLEWDDEGIKSYRKDFIEPFQKVKDEMVKETYKGYKPFRQQYLECIENGNLIKIDTLPMKGVYGYDVGIILVCVKHQKICGSNVCKEERFTAL